MVADTISCQENTVMNQATNSQNSTLFPFCFTNKKEQTVESECKEEAKLMRIKLDVQSQDSLANQRNSQLINLLHISKEQGLNSTKVSDQANEPDLQTLVKEQVDWLQKQRQALVQQARQAQLREELKKE